MVLNNTQELIDDFRLGKMVILIDDEDRENEGDLLIAGSHISAETINFMATHGRGLICLTLTVDRCRQLDLPLMVSENNAQHGTNFTLSIEAAEGVTTGISAADRAKTVQAAVARNATPKDIVQPGHIFPLMAQPGGVLHRAGHTEAGCDLAKLAGLEPAAVIVEIMNEDGTMARREDLEKFAEKHDLKMGTIADLIQYRAFNEKTIQRVEEANIKTVNGEFKLVVFKDTVDELLHTALIKGEIDADEPVMVRVHNYDPVRDLMGTMKNGKTGWSYFKSQKAIAEAGCGILILLGYDFMNEEMEYRLSQLLGSPVKKTEAVEAGGYKTVGIGSQILRELGVKKMRLLSPEVKFNAISGFDLEIVEYVEAED